MASNFYDSSTYMKIIFQTNFSIPIDKKRHRSTDKQRYKISRIDQINCYHKTFGAFHVKKIIQYIS